MNERATTGNPRQSSRNRPAKVLTWTVWLIAAGVSGVGLRHYRIDNDLGSWAPDLTPIGAVESYVIVGFETTAFDESEVAASLRALPPVSTCIDSAVLNRMGGTSVTGPENFTLSEDGSYTGIFAFRQAGVDDDTFVREVRTVLRAYDPTLDRFAVAGPAVFHTALNAYSQQRLPLIMLLINVVGGVWLWSITGKPIAAVTGVTAIVLSQVVLLGVVSWLRVPVDMSLSMVPPLIMALGYSYAAHRVLRPGITTTLALCGGTTCAGIASVGISALAPLRMFALYGTLGIVLVWLAVVTLLPEPAPRNVGHARRHRWLEPLLRCNLAVVQRYRKQVVLAGVCVTIAALVAIPFLRFETNPLGYFPSEARIARDFATIDARLTGTLPFQVTVSGSPDPTALLLSTPGVKKIINVSAIVGGPDSTYWGLAQNRALPDLTAAQESWHAWATANHVTLKWRGVAAQIDATGHIIRRVAVITLPAMGLIAALSAGFVTGSLRVGVVSAWVNLLPICGMILTAAVAQLTIGLPALMIGAIAVGMAIDDTLHLVRAFQWHGGTTRGLLRCWRPCVGSTFVAASCLSLFALSPFLPTRQFGTLLAVTGVFALIADMLLLPVLVQRRPGTLTRRLRAADPTAYGSSVRR